MLKIEINEVKTLYEAEEICLNAINLSNTPIKCTVTDDETEEVVPFTFPQNKTE